MKVIKPGKTEVVKIDANIVIGDVALSPGSYWITRLASEDFHVDLNENMFHVQGDKIKLTPCHAVVVFALCEVYPKTASHEFIIDCIYGKYGDTRTNQNVRTAIKWIRRDIADTDLNIVNEHGLGYRFEIKRRINNG